MYKRLSGVMFDVRRSYRIMEERIAGGHILRRGYYYYITPGSLLHSDPVGRDMKHAVLRWRVGLESGAVAIIRTNLL